MCSRLLAASSLSSACRPFSVRFSRWESSVYFCPIDVGPILTLEPTVFALPYFVESLTQVVHDVEFVEQNTRLRCVPDRRVPKCLPHVHHGQSDSAALLGPQFSIEQVHARFLPVLPAEPDCSPPQQIAHH